jgi:putative heme-binding domain-containing protein
MVDDPDPAVRYQVALTLGEFRGDLAVGAALAKLAMQDGASKWSRAAVLSSILAAPLQFAQRLAAEGGDIETLAPLRSAVLTTLVSAGKADALAAWVKARFASELSAPRAAEAMNLLRALSASPEIEAQLGNSTVAGSLKRLRAQVEASAFELVLASETSAETRTAALRLLGETARTDGTRRAELLRLVEKALPEPLRPILVETLQRQEAPEIAGGLLQDWVKRQPSQRLTLLPVLLSRPAWTGALLSAVEQGRVAAAELSSIQRQQLRAHQDGTLRARAEALFPPAASDRAAVLQRFAGVAALKGDRDKGSGQFDRLCASCHARKGRGSSVGPDLTAFLAKPVEDFVTAILDPNAAIEPHYAMWTAEMKDGRVLAGIAQDESSTALTLSQPGGVRTVVQRSGIVRLTPMPLSLMPVGLEEGLAPQDLADLVAWITAPLLGSATAQSR